MSSGFLLFLLVGWIAGASPGGGAPALFPVQTLMLTSTPLGSSSFIRASTVFDVEL